MMGITFRGYTIWVINVVLCIYFFTQTFKITDYNRIKVSNLFQSSRYIYRMPSLKQNLCLYILNRKQYRMRRLCRPMEQCRRNHCHIRIHLARSMSNFQFIAIGFNRIYRIFFENNFVLQKRPVDWIIAHVRSSNEPCKQFANGNTSSKSSGRSIRGA